jgi:hypothetical protein
MESQAQAHRPNPQDKVRVNRQTVSVAVTDDQPHLTLTHHESYLQQLFRER